MSSVLCQKLCSSVSLLSWSEGCGWGWRRGLCICVHVCVCVFSFPLPLSSWQQPFNEDREKGAICNMILSHCPHCDPHTWERVGPALITALPQTQLSASRQVSATSTSILRLYWSRMKLGDRRKQVKEKSNCEEKGKNQEKILHTPDSKLELHHCAFWYKRFPLELWTLAWDLQWSWETLLLENLSKLESLEFTAKVSTVRLSGLNQFCFLWVWTSFRSHGAKLLRNKQQQDRLGLHMQLHNWTVPGQSNWEAQDRWLTVRVAFQLYLSRGIDEYVD